MKLWQKNNNTLSGDSSKEVEKFTVGNDRKFDLLLAPFDVLGNIAHAKMLATVGLLTNDEANTLTKDLQAIYKTIRPENSPLGEGGFTIHDNIEDIHSPNRIFDEPRNLVTLVKKYILPAAVTTVSAGIQNYS